MEFVSEAVENNESQDQQIRIPRKPLSYQCIENPVCNGMEEQVLKSVDLG